MNVTELGSAAAGDLAWKIGMAGALWMAVLKYIISYFGRTVQKSLPQMALVGAMVGIATVWLGAEAVYGIFALPEVGLLSLVIMIFALTANHKLPFALPGAIMAIILTTIIYYILAIADFGRGYELIDLPGITPVLPTFSLGGLSMMFGDGLNYLGIVLPFGLLIAASGINIVAGAKITGDEYNANEVVRADALTTAISALAGGVVQTTPYFGHITYKRMGAKTNYALGAAALITIGGLVGVIAMASQLIPGAVLKPILIVVACDIIRLAVAGADPRHAPALIFSMMPGILNYAFNKVSALFDAVERGIANTSLTMQQLMGSDWIANYGLLATLSRGYILTSLLWATMIIWIIDNEQRKAAVVAFVTGFFTLFGVIHSVLPSSQMYLPWELSELGGLEQLPYRLASGYVIAGIALLLLGGSRDERTTGEAPS